jgi:hypothetical protein
MSDAIRFDNVHVPFCEGKKYGSGYVYLNLPGFAGEIFAEAGRTSQRSP